MKISNIIEKYGSKFPIWYIEQTLHEVQRKKYSRDLSKRTKYTCDSNYFREINSKDKAYFLGLLVADGCNHRIGFNIALEEGDKYILEKFIICINYTGSLYYIKRKSPRKNMFKLNITDLQISKDLTRLGVVPAKSLITYFPNIEERYRSHFIRGVFDGDGCIHIGKEKKKTFSICGNKILIEEIQKILMKKCNLHETKLQINKNADINFRVMNYSGNLQIKRIEDYLYRDCDNLFLTRKRDKFKITTIKKR